MVGRHDGHEVWIAEARRMFGLARRVVALTGAGISTDSGIPDYRGPKGVWTRDPEAEKLSDIRYYMSDPAIRARAWQARLASPGWLAQPNRGHAALVELERRGQLGGIVTQNIDGLHQAAGNTASMVVEIHGTMREVMCMGRPVEGHQRASSPEALEGCGYRAPMELVAERLAAGEVDPDCPACGGILKSATISFGQSLVEADLRRAEELARGCDLFLAIGTTLAVYPAAGLLPVAKSSGAGVVILNGEPTQMDALADVVIHGSIGELLPAMVGAPDA